MRAATWLLIASAFLSTSCGFAWRVLGRNLSAPPMKRVEHKVLDPRRADARLSLLWVGHATMLVQLDDVFVLTDPVFTNTLGQVSPRLVEPGLDVSRVPPLAAIVVSHMHFDHLSFGSLDMLEARTKVVLVPPGVRANMPRYDFEIRELSRWTAYEKNGLRITAVPVKHVGGRLGIDEAFAPLAFTGYVLEYHGLSVYFSGDTAFAEGMFRETGARFPGLSAAILPICPNEPRDFMQRTHIDPVHALDAFTLLGAARMVPMHFDTFINSDDDFGACPRILRTEMTRRGLTDDQVSVLEIGEQRVLIPR
jgi:L-ascorbate metabolism protein UlaG (beta-lactamase superfamily)